MTNTSRPRSFSIRVRIWRLVIIAVLLIAIAGGYYEFQLRRPMGAGQVAIAIEENRYSEIWSNRPVLLLALGDSITAGYGASPGRSYFNLVANSRDDDFSDVQGICLKRVLPKLTTQNSAISGSTSIDLVSFSLPRIEKQAEDVFGVVLLTTGGNDVIHNYGQTPPKEGAMYGATLAQAAPWIANYEQRLNKILDDINTKFPGGCEIFLGNIYDPTDGQGDTQNAGLPRWPDGLQVLDRYNAIIAGTCRARKNVHLIDIRSAFLGHGIHCRQFWRTHYQYNDPYYWYFENLEDPNDRGYDALRRLFLNKIGQVVPERLPIHSAKHHVVN